MNNDPVKLKLDICTNSLPFYFFLFFLFSIFFIKCIHFFLFSYLLQHRQNWDTFCIVYFVSLFLIGATLKYLLDFLICIFRSLNESCDWKWRAKLIYLHQILKYSIQIIYEMNKTMLNFNSHEIFSIDVIIQENSFWIYDVVSLKQLIFIQFSL